MSIDFASFNEVSHPIEDPPSSETVGNWLEALALLMKEAKKIGFLKLRTHREFRSMLVADSEILHNVLIGLRPEVRGFLFAVLDSPYIKNTKPFDADEPVCIQILKVQGKEEKICQGVVCALLQETLLISFPSEARWQDHRVWVDYNTGKSTKVSSLPHASDINHLKNHVIWASRRTPEQKLMSATEDNPLPNSIFVRNHVVYGDWQNFFRKMDNLDTGSRTASLMETASIVAKMNGYAEEAEISSKNQKRFGKLRQIFSTGLGKNRLYLSTDFEKQAGAFEVCDYEGTHIGEWLFSGIKNASADTTGRHNIIL